MKETKIQMMELESIIPYEKNPRHNENAIESVAASIRMFGFKSPIVVSSDNVIICGHTRYRASQKLGLKEVPVIVADDLTEEQVQAYRVADNKTGEKATWDMDLLAEELRAIDDTDIDMALLGFEEFELMALLDDATPDSYDKDLIDKYSRDDEELLKEKRIIITYKNEEEEEFLMNLLKCSKLQVKNEADKIMERF